MADALSEATEVRPGRLARGPILGRLWEQTLLPFRSRNGVLLSPANAGPVVHPCHVVVIHDLIALERPDLVSRSYRLLQRLTLPSIARRAVGVIVPSEQVATSVEKRLRIPRERIAVVEPAVSRSLVENGAAAGPFPIEIGKSTQMVFGLNSSIPRKNGALLLRVFERVVEADDSIIAVVAGADGPRRVFGRSERPASDVVIDLGEVDDMLLGDLYERASVFVFLSEEEGYGMPVREAIAARTPVVCTRVPATLGAESHCRIVDSADEDGIVRAVLEVVRNDPASPPEPPERRWSDVAEEIGVVLALSAQKRKIHVGGV